MFSYFITISPNYPISNISYPVITALSYVIATKLLIRTPTNFPAPPFNSILIYNHHLTILITLIYVLFIILIIVVAITKR